MSILEKLQPFHILQIKNRAFIIERRKKYKLRFVYIKKDYLLGISYDELVLDVSSLKRVFCFEIKLDMYRFHSFKLSSIHTTLSVVCDLLWFLQYILRNSCKAIFFCNSLKRIILFEHVGSVLRVGKIIFTVNEANG